jgi:hypothetical protein
MVLDKGYFYSHLALISELDSIEARLEHRHPQSRRIERLPALWVKDERFHCLRYLRRHTMAPTLPVSSEAEALGRG